MPLPASGSGTAYAKLPHPASGYVVVSAGRSNHPAGIRLVLFSPGGSRRIGQRADEGRRLTEAELQGKALTPEVIASAAARPPKAPIPIDDTYASADYKRQVATVYARRAIEAAVKRAVV